MEHKVKLIPLSRGLFAKVDDQDYEWLSQWNWYCSVSGYAVRAAPRNAPGRRIIRMHMLIAGTPDGMETDHIDRDKLNNQRKNLRVCDRFQNAKNTSMRKNNKSGYKGVCFMKLTGKWRARIRNNKKLIYIGLFNDPEEAAKAYDKFAKKLFGEYAVTNF